MVTSALPGGRKIELELKNLQTQRENSSKIGIVVIISPVP